MFEVGILSFEREDFVASASGQRQRAGRRGRAGHDPDPIRAACLNGQVYRQETPCLRTLPRSTAYYAIG